MPDFTSLLTNLCDIQVKARTTTGYEKVLSWSNVATGVHTRKDSSTGASIQDTQIRLNTDDDVFFFNADVVIKRGNRIVFDSENYDVIKVNKCYGGSSAIHHLEVVARLVDHE